MTLIFKVLVEGVVVSRVAYCRVHSWLFEWDNLRFLLVKVVMCCFVERVSMENFGSCLVC